LTTFIVANKRVKLGPVTLRRILKETVGTIYTNFETYSSFSDMGIVVINRPKIYMLNVLEHGVVDKVIQVGYDGAKCETTRLAEELGVDVILFRRME
jgi:hypothetical protein